jgi:hypothetical protein
MEQDDRQTFAELVIGDVAVFPQIRMAAAPRSLRQAPGAARDPMVEQSRNADRGAADQEALDKALAALAALQLFRALSHSRRIPRRFKASRRAQEPGFSKSPDFLQFGDSRLILEGSITP